ncbi:helix-turn-helix domain-containing protein [Streptomyces fagopyri]|nr:helix-turn-helix transcriptional regulator [Streptomyces fagopyri]
MDEEVAIGHPAQPTSDEVALYGWAAVHERMDVDAAAIDLELSRDGILSALSSLTERGLIHLSDDDAAPLRLMDPKLVADVVTAPMEMAIRRQQASLDAARGRFSGLHEHYLEGMRRRSLKVELVPRLEEVRAALNRAAAECKTEVLTSQPGGNRVPEALEEALKRDSVTLARGVRMRTLYQHTARFNGPSQSYVAAMTQLGAEYRTAHELFGRLIVFDREVAFIPEAGGTWGAVIIREPSIVHYMCDIFEQTWSLAQPFSDATTDGLETVAREVDRTIARLLAAGLKDETIARRLGMSLRTARRHIADIMESLGAESRFQAGVIMASRGLLKEDKPTLQE